MTKGVFEKHYKKDNKREREKSGNKNMPRN